MSDFDPTITPFNEDDLLFDKIVEPTPTCCCKPSQALKPLGIDEIVLDEAAKSFTLMTDMNDFIMIKKDGFCSYKKLNSTISPWTRFWKKVKYFFKSKKDKKETK